jgi:hypothetical protein
MLLQVRQTRNTKLAFGLLPICVLTVIYAHSACHAVALTYGEIASVHVRSRVIVNVRNLLCLQNCNLRICADLLRYSVEGRTHVSISGFIQASSHLCLVCG